jgi:hypothetical protein
MDKPVLFGLLVFCLCFLWTASTSSGEQYEDFLKRYSRKSADIIQLSQSVKEPSDYSKSIQSKLIGHWRCLSEFSSDLPKIILKSLTFYDNGSVKYNYEVKDENRIMEMTESYEICHKGSPRHRPGKGPNVIIKSRALDDSSVIPLIDVSVDYDNRFPITMGELLKFSDLEGNHFVFVRDYEPGSPIPKSETYIDTLGVDAAEKDSHGNLKQKRVVNAAVTKEVLASLREGKLTEPQKNKAILRLMNEGDSSCVPVLIEHLSNVHSLVVRQNAIRALGKIGDKRAVAPLLKILKEPVKGDITDEGEEETILRRRAVLALGEIGDASALPVLEAVAQDSKEYQSVRELSTIAVEKIKVSERERGKLRE